MFVQRTDARIDIVALEHQAARFFRTKVGFMDAKAYGEDSPVTDVAAIAVMPPGRDTSTRKLLARPATESDYALAERLEVERSALGVGVGGLGALARRCPYVFEIERSADDDEAALVLAAIVASTFLGPIVDPEARDLFGVKTARVRLNGLV